ncbi:hypothetical protein NKJ59_05295 [Mesorhizobium australicum]|uniref:hypothetical protein n=1 Tax=Mesorhizobium australicum TaxID=536018 RepID=UPI003336A36A
MTSGIAIRIRNAACENSFLSSWTKARPPRHPQSRTAPETSAKVGLRPNPASAFLDQEGRAI